ncbi:MAG: clostripain-related cysteine peptidase [Bacilli bacterium]|nr:clostripain-related cysteine peptidase [Bacilli bacterium]
MIKSLRKLMLAFVGCVSLMLSGCTLFKPSYNGSLNFNDISLMEGSGKQLSIKYVTKNDLPLSAYTYTWTSEDPSIANVSESGYVTAINAGTTNINVTIQIPGNTSDLILTCKCTVIGKVSLTLNKTSAQVDVGKTLQLVATVKNTTNKSVIWKTSSSTLATVDDNGLVEVTSSAAYIGRTVKITCTSVADSSAYDICTITVTEEAPVSVSLNKVSARIRVGKSTILEADVSHASDTSVIWESNNSNVTVNDGTVTVLETASVGSTATIKATSVEDSTAFATCLITVIDGSSYAYDYTIMFYMCASTLENDEENSSGGGYWWNNTRATGADPGLFTEDILEILSVNLPDSVKVIIETGGTTKWAMKSTYLIGATSISNTKLQRWEVTNKKLKLVETLGTNHMADQDSYESFLKWGLEDYSAEQMGVVISGHGAGVGGCAFDDNYTYSDDYYEYQHALNTSQIATATKNALATSDRDKFTWMGFDCCLMGSADIASVMADYFDYMVASQESELGEGWDHDDYMNLLVSDPCVEPTVLLPQIAKSFVKAGHDTYCSSKEKCLQTLSVLDLSKMNNFVTAFNNYVSNTGSSSYSKYKAAFKNAYNSFGEGYYGLVDFSSYLDKLETQFTGVSTSQVRTALSNLVIANEYCSRYTITPCGLNAFLPEVVATGRDAALQPGKEDYTGSYATKFSAYQTMCLANGDWSW